MTYVLEISTLGKLDIRLAGEPIRSLASRKADALLIFLAQTGRPHFRETLAEMFWDDQPLSRSLSNLSVLLTSFRKNLPGYIQADRKLIWFDTQKEYRLDARLLEQQLEEANRRKATTTGMDRETARLIETALEYFKGSFLAGFQLRDGRGFEEWLVIERERIHYLVFEHMSDLVTFYLNIGEYGESLRFANRLLSLDPLREETHRQLMLLLARNGQRLQALEQYNSCKQILEEELGVEPSPYTTSLYHRIREADHAKVSLPRQAVPFVGRESELALIGSRLANPDCRLLTLVGPGGVGKTRLAVEAAHLNEHAFLNGIGFVQLEMVDSANLFISTVGSALGFTFFGREAPLQQLIHFLGEKELLLILDNFEHLISLAHLLDDLLKNCQHIKLLITSRERLNIRAEWLFEVNGLRVTPAEVNRDKETSPLSDALALFVQNAQRVQANFVLHEENFPDVMRICQLVDGFPLGIELAASWVRVLPPKDIADEISLSIDFLESSLQDVPQRHRSMRAVFDHAWQRFSPYEQDALRKLSVMRGDFRREAAWAVAGASLHTLANLVNRSFLQANRGWYKMHELIRQYAGAQWAAQAEQLQETVKLHCEYYAGFLAARSSALWGGATQRTVLEEISTEINNIRAAWKTATHQGIVQAIHQALAGYSHFLEMRSWFQEGIEATGQAVAALSNHPLEDATILSSVLNWQGRFYSHLGQFTEAEACFAQSRVLTQTTSSLQLAESLSGLSRVAMFQRDQAQAITLAEQAQHLFMALKQQPGLAEVFVNLSEFAREQGDYPAALHHAEAALQIYRDHQDEWNEAKCLSSVGSVYGAIGDYTKARQCFEKGMEICQALGDQYGIARNAHNLSNIAYFDEDYEKAHTLRLLALDICREIGYEWGVASALQHVGAVERMLGNLAEAQHYYRESLTRFQALGEQRSASYVLNMMGNLAVQRNEHKRAIQYFREGLVIAKELNLAPLITAILAGLAEIIARGHDQEFALALCMFVVQHPGTEQQTRDTFQTHIQRLSSGLDESAIQRVERQVAIWAGQDKLDQVFHDTLAKANAIAQIS